MRGAEARLPASEVLFSKWVRDSAAVAWRGVARESLKLAFTFLFWDRSGAGAVVASSSIRPEGTARQAISKKVRRRGVKLGEKSEGACSLV